LGRKVARLVAKWVGESVMKRQQAVIYEADEDLRRIKGKMDVNGVEKLKRIQKQS
jgi:hypothetical protein